MRVWEVVALAGVLAAAGLPARAAPPAPSPSAPVTPPSSQSSQSQPAQSQASQGQPAPHAPVMPAAPHLPPRPDPNLAFYPAAARAAGIEGTAQLTCQRDVHIALRDCVVTAEHPAGQGFGAAALAMTAKSQDNPKVAIADAKDRPPISFTVKFALHPPSITPDMTGMGHTLAGPTLVAPPTPAQIQAAYPVRALDDGIDGEAIIDCLVTETGKLVECQVYAEDPSGYGFGQASLELAPDFALKPRLVDGAPSAGAEVRLRVPFIHDPAAPLTLKVTPGQ